MDAISQTTLSNAFTWTKMLEFRLTLNRSLLLKVWLNNIPTLAKKMAWCWLGDKPLSEPMMVNLLTHICVTRPQWVNPHRSPIYGSLGCNYTIQTDLSCYAKLIHKRKCLILSRHQWSEWRLFFWILYAENVIPINLNPLCYEYMMKCIMILRE